MDIYSNVKDIKGIGEKTASYLKALNIYTVIDLLLHIPKEYEYMTPNLPIASNSDKAILNVTVKSIKNDFFTQTGKRISTIVFNSSIGTVYGKWFNSPYSKNVFKLNETYNIYGTLVKDRGANIIRAPKIIKNDLGDIVIKPKYPLTEGITNESLYKYISYALENVIVKENLPVDILEKFNLCSMTEAFQYIHTPKTKEQLERGIYRLKFQELLIYSMKIYIFKRDKEKENKGNVYKMASELSLLKEKLPFDLTNAQRRVVREILIDQKTDKAMNRLIQGDVGSGKTLVCLISVFNVLYNNFQGAIMAPTEILARQHYLEAIKLFKDFDLKVELLVGSISKKQKNSIKEALARGDINLIIGTHALIEEDVEFKNLGIIITDEQHRFGVYQRAKLFNKAKNSDVIVMSATPIPRTLALSLYGDLDVSIIDELPPGRTKIATFALSESQKEKAYKVLDKEVSSGRQGYIVCPLIEDNEEGTLNSVEKVANNLKIKYPMYNIGILHGKMADIDKEATINLFRENEINILVSTTVIEVGVNVPNATVMIIENAERFGLSQLHQLRGRVGRGIYKSCCILISNSENEVTKKRMQIMTTSSDGFYIAEQDLLLRGSGELLGTRQHGETQLITSNIIEDYEIFKLANSKAKEIVYSEDDIFINFKENIKTMLHKKLKEICYN